MGEVNSDFFYCHDPVIRKETLSLLKSGDANEEKKGIERHQLTRKIFIDTIPSDTKWFIASLSINEDEFRRLRTIKDHNGWNRYSRGTYLLVDAVNYLIENPCIDPRVWSIIQRFPELIKDKDNMIGLTFLSETKEGPYIITEGTARLVAIYYHCIVNKVKLFEDNAIEVVLGVSRIKWDFSPL